MSLPQSTLQQPELMNMPNIVLQRIAGYVGFHGVARLQKVNQRFRGLLQEETVNLNGVTISINDEADCICGENRVDCLCRDRVLCIYGSEKENFMTRYTKTNNGCQVMIKTYNREGKQVKGKPVDFFNKDFKEKGVLEKLGIHSDGSPDPNFLARISEFMRVRNNLLQTKVLDFSVCNCDEIHLMLPLLDPTKLQDIHIKNQTEQPLTLTTLEMDRLATLEQWKMAKKIVMWSNLVVPNASIQHFHHLTNASFIVESFGFADFLRLKQTILSSDFIRFHISFKRDLEDEDQFVALIGEMFEGSIGEMFRIYWHFHVPNHEEDVFSVQLTYRYLHLDRTNYFKSRKFSKKFPIFMQPMFKFP